MFQDFLGSGSLNLIYTAVLGVSFIFAVISLLGAEFSHAFDLDADIDVDSDGFDFVSISPFAIAMFGATFGLVGLLTRLWLEMGTIPSILWATGLGLIIGTVAQLFFLYVLSPSKSSHFSLSEDAVKRVADVIITIPPDGIGTIAFDNVSGRVTLGARSATRKKIHTGTAVIIEKVVGRVAYVHPVEE